MDEVRQQQAEILESDRPPLAKTRALHLVFADRLGRNDDFARVMLDIWGAGMRDPERFGIDFPEAADDITDLPYRGVRRPETS